MVLGAGRGCGGPVGLRPVPAISRCGVLLELDLPIGRVPGRTEGPGGFRWRERGVVSGYTLVGVLDGA
jgi:hypothetical protein